MMEGSHILASLADADNGIGDLFARNVYATNVTAQTGNFQTTNASTTNTNELCVGSTCITEAQLTALLSQSAGANTAISVSSSPSNRRDASPQNPSLDLTNSGNPDTANPSSSAAASSTATTSNSDATTSLPLLDAPPLVPEYLATPTVPPAAASSAAE